MKTRAIDCIRTMDDLDALHEFVSVQRSELTSTNFTNNNEQHSNSLSFVGLRIAVYMLLSSR